MPGVHHVPDANCYRCPLNLKYPSCNVQCARDMDDMIRTSTSGRIAAFIAEPMECWRMIHDRQGQAAHCPEEPSWTGRWFAPSGKQWWRVWACPDHLEGLTGLREFGRARR